tara:strand:+ start:4586 stop:4825 length:240 start_codon:yes stop_codon:yes gene_type:complete
LGKKFKVNKGKTMDKVLAIFSFIKGWVSSRLKERTSWDGAALITAGVCFLLFKGIATLVAWAAIAYGAWTLWKEEYKKD